MASQRDYYQILGVSETATTDEIKKAFRRLAKQYHPDRNPNNPKGADRFKEINEAHDVLSDAEKRKKYDQLRRYGAFAGAGRGGFGGGGSGGGGGGTAQGPDVDFDLSDLGSFGGLGDLFSSIFGRRGTGARLDDEEEIETAISIPFRVAALGGKVPVTLTLPEVRRLGRRARSDVLDLPRVPGTRHDLVRPGRLHRAAAVPRVPWTRQGTVPALSHLSGVGRGPSGETSDDHHSGGYRRRHSAAPQGAGREGQGRHRRGDPGRARPVLSAGRTRRDRRGPDQSRSGPARLEDQGAHPRREARGAQGAAGHATRPEIPDPRAGDRAERPARRSVRRGPCPDSRQAHARAGSGPAGVRREERHEALGHSCFTITNADFGQAVVNSGDSNTTESTCARVIAANPNFGKKRPAVSVSRYTVRTPRRRARSSAAAVSAAPSPRPRSR